MHRPARISTLLASLAGLGLLLPAPVQAAPATTNQAGRPNAADAAQSFAIDVALAPGGVLNGQAVDGSGNALPDHRVLVLQAGQMVAETRTHADGGFQVAGLPGGVYELRCANGAAFARLWAPNTAPPIARSTVLLTSDEALVRGQMQTRGGGLLKGPLPWIVAVAAIIAVPTALALNLKPASQRGPSS